MNDLSVVLPVDLELIHKLLDSVNIPSGSSSKDNKPMTVEGRIALLVMMYRDLVINYNSYNCERI